MNTFPKGTFEIEAYRGHQLVRIRCEEVMDDMDWILRMHGVFGTLEAPGPELFSALSTIRSMLEPDGYRFLINGCRLNAWPSGMQRDQAGGRVVYLFESIAPRARTIDTVPTFGPAPAESVVDLGTQSRAIDTVFSGFRSPTRHRSGTMAFGARPPFRTRTPEDRGVRSAVWPDVGVHDRWAFHPKPHHVRGSRQ